MAAQHLSALGLQPGDVLSSHLHNCMEYIIAFLACAALGGARSSESPSKLEPCVRRVVPGCGRPTPLAASPRRATTQRMQRSPLSVTMNAPVMPSSCL